MARSGFKIKVSFRVTEDINEHERFSVGDNAESPINTNSIGSQKGKMR
jgi:hypothetical protein